MKQTNYLTPDLFYKDFQDWLIRLEPFHSDTIIPPMSANQFYFATRIQYGCALRITEVLNLVPNDFDFDHRILTIRNPKTNKGGKQLTTIMPYDVKPFEKFCAKYNQDQRMFTATRSTMWKYYKNASILGGMNIFEAKQEKMIEGAWTHLMRSSCSKLYEDKGAKESLTARKLRHSPKTVTQMYTRSDLQSVLSFDEEHFQVCPITPANDKTYEVLFA